MQRFWLCLLLVLFLAGCSNQPKKVVVDYETVAEQVHRDTQRARELNQHAVELIKTSQIEEAEEGLKQALSADVMFGPAIITWARSTLSKRRCTWRLGNFSTRRG